MKLGRFSLLIISFLALVVLDICLSSCADERSANQMPNQPHYDLLSLVKNQIQWLDSLNPQVKKVIIMDEKKEEQIDTVNWDHELVFFRDTDLNKPVLVDSYLIEETSVNGARQLHYQIKDTTASGVTELTIYFAPESAQVDSLKSIFVERNLLYRNQRKASMSFVQIDGRHGLGAYQLEGAQKVIFLDPVKYSIIAEVLYQ